MKTTVVVAVWICLVYAGFCIDRLIFNAIIEQVPINEWLGIIKIAVGVVLFCLSAGIIFGISSAIAMIINVSFKD